MEFMCFHNLTPNLWKTEQETVKYDNTSCT